MSESTSTTTTTDDQTKMRLGVRILFAIRAMPRRVRRWVSKNRDNIVSMITTLFMVAGIITTGFAAYVWFGPAAIISMATTALTITAIWAAIAILAHVISTDDEKMAYQVTQMQADRDTFLAQIRTAAEQGMNKLSGKGDALDVKATASA